MSEQSNTLENEIINVFYRNQSQTLSGNVYAALFTSNPDEDGSGTEVSGNNYSRQQITLGAPSDGVSTNTNDLLFEASGGDWGTITHAAVFDAASGGNLMDYSSLDASEVINDGQTYTIPAGSLSVTKQ